MNYVKQDYVNMWNEVKNYLQPDVYIDVLERTGRGGKESVIEDYVQALTFVKTACALTSIKDLKKFDSLNDLKNIFPSSLKKRMDIRNLMLFYPYSQLKDSEQAILWPSPRFVKFRLYKGFRFLMVKEPGSFVRAYSRYPDSLNFTYRNYSRILGLPKFHESERFLIDMKVLINPNLDIVNILKDYGIYSRSHSEALSMLLSMNEELAIEIREEVFNEYKTSLYYYNVIYPLFFGESLVNSLHEGVFNIPLVEEYLRQHLNIIGVNLANTLSKEEFDNICNFDSNLKGILFYDTSSKYNTGRNASKSGIIKYKISEIKSNSQVMCEESEDNKMVLLKSKECNKFLRWVDKDSFSLFNLTNV